MVFKKINRCRICYSKGLINITNLNDQYLQGSFVKKSQSSSFNQQNHRSMTQNESAIRQTKLHHECFFKVQLIWYSRFVLLLKTFFQVAILHSALRVFRLVSVVYCWAERGQPMINELENESFSLFLLIIWMGFHNDNSF